MTARRAAGVPFWSHHTLVTSVTSGLLAAERTCVPCRRLRRNPVATSPSRDGSLVWCRIAAERRSNALAYIQSIEQGITVARDAGWTFPRSAAMNRLRLPYGGMDAIPRGQGWR